MRGKVHCKFKRVILIWGSHFNTIIRRIIFTLLMCRFDFNNRFDTSMPTKSRNDSKSVSNSFKSHFEMTPWVFKMTLLIKRVKLTLYWCQPKRNQNDSLEGVVLGSRKRLLWRSQNGSFELTVYCLRFFGYTFRTNRENEVNNGFIIYGLVMSQFNSYPYLLAVSGDVLASW